MFTSHGVLLLHALDALLSSSLVVVVTAASDEMHFSAIYALLVEAQDPSAKVGGNVQQPPMIEPSSHQLLELKVPGASSSSFAGFQFQ
ncbi:hypothetical protein AK812_SmicGene44840 [Symbiodinium microadriaticum]|uniref:Secreted protein n=1 Tax=Symbiodinium microadriaticum TaxID=2951 RepID=A0A1Q9BXL6_SYMMI|nr:hypothetical protein AK812_SmicGene44840 [Symbiodinium microadriaticum]